MVSCTKFKVFVTGLLAASLAFSAIGSAQAATTTIEESGTRSIFVGDTTLVFNATTGCSFGLSCEWTFENPGGLTVVSSSEDEFTVTTGTPGSYAFDITGKRGNDVYISHWTIIATAPASAPAPAPAPVVVAKKYSVSVTGYTYKKKGMSTIDNNRAAVVASYLRSLGLNDTNSDYVVTGMELTKNTKKARSAVISVTYMKDGKSVTVKKTIYFTAKKFSLTKKSKTTMKKLSISVM